MQRSIWKLLRKRRQPCLSVDSREVELHRSEINGFHAGGYPVKAASKVLEVLNNLEANSEFKGRDLDRMRIIHASAARGRVIKGYTPRAQGRSSPSFNTLVHIELVATEA